MKIKKNNNNNLIIMSLILVVIILCIISFNYKSTYSLNQDEDYILNSEWIEYMNSSEQEKEEYEIIPDKYLVSYNEENNEIVGAEVDLPNYYNLHDLGLVTDPRNQGSLGLCWAFAAINTIESGLLVSGESNINNPLLFSERQLDYATANKKFITEKYNPYANSGRNELGTGALGNLAFKTFSLGIAPVSSSIFGEYNSNKTDTKSIKQVLDIDNVGYDIDGWVNIGSVSATTSSEKRESWINAIKNHLVTYGALTITTIGPSPTYAGSCLLYDSENENYLLNVLDNNCNPQNTANTHAMSIIGWDDNYTYEYCRKDSTTTLDLTDCENIISGQGAFILKNSWGSIISYPHFAYTSNTSGVYGITGISSKEWDNNYDNTKKNSTKFISKGKIINYKKNSNLVEKLEKISFNKGDTKNNVYSVYVSSNGDDNYQKIGDVEAGYTGSYSIKPSNDILLSSDSFSIKLQSLEGTNISNIYAFTSFQENTSNPTAETTIDEGNSFYNFVDKISVVTNTKNIPTGDTIEYRLYDNNNVDITSLISVNNNIVLNNSLITDIYFNDSINSSKVTLKTLYSNQVLDSEQFEITELESLWSAGSGSINDPFIINNVDDFSKIFTNDGYLAANYKLGGNIDFTNSNWQKNTKTFTGTFNGDNHMLNGYSCNSTSCGIFYSSQNATISNLIINNFTINLTSSGSTALLFTTSKNTDFNNIIITESNTITNAGYYSGGLVATAYDCTFSRIANFGNYSVSSSSGGVGGLVGDCSGCNIYESFNYGNMNSADGDAGGIVGQSSKSSYTANETVIHDVYNFGTITANDYAGGICGYAISTNISNVYSIINNVQQSGYFGNIVGLLNDSIITYAYSNNNGKGIIGKTMGTTSSTTNSGVKSDSDLRKQLSYVGFDFVNTWKMGTYPYLVNFNYTKVTSLQVPNKIIVEKDSNYSINITYNPSNALIKNVLFTSSNTDVAEVDINGIVTAKSIGNAVITMRTIDGSNITKTVNIEVAEEGVNEIDYDIVDDTYIMIEDLTLVNEFRSKISLANQNYRAVLSSESERLFTGEQLFIYRNDDLINTYHISVLGDVTGTGTINVSDVAKLYSYIKGKIEMDEVYQIAADVTNDDNLRVNDVAKLYSYIKGKIERLG